MINFPDSPTVGQQFSSGGAVWQWDGAKWVSVPSTSGSGYVAKSGDTMTGNLVINESGGALPAAYATTELQLASPSGTTSRIVMDANAASATLTMRRSDGAWNAPTAIASGDNIGGMNFVGFANGVYGAAVASFAAWSPAAWTATSNPAFVALATTPVNATAQVEMARLQPSGGVSIGNSSFNGGYDPGQGTLAVQSSIKVNQAAWPMPSDIGTPDMIHAVAGLNVANISTYDTLGSCNYLIGRRTDGTYGAPTALQQGDPIFCLIARGTYAGGYANANSALMQMTAAANWTSSSFPTIIDFQTTPIGATAVAEAMRVQASGGVSIGTAAWVGVNDPGAGALTTQNGIQLPQGFPVHDNRIINGSFDVWQLGTSFTISPNSAGYTADQWVGVNGGGGTSTIVVQKWTTGAGFTYQFGINAYSTANLIVGQVMQLITRFEAANIGDLDNKVTTLSFDIQGATNSGSLAATVSWNWNTAIDNGSYSVASPSRSFAVPGGFSGRTVITFPASDMVGAAKGGQLIFTFQQNAVPGAMSIGMSSVKLERGPFAQPWIPKGIAREVVDCQRYLEKSYDLGVQPGAVGGAGASLAYWGGNTSAVYTLCANINFKVTKRTTPTVILYSMGSGASGKVRDAGNNVDVNASIFSQGYSAFGWYGSPSAAATSANLQAHWVADARL